MQAALAYRLCCVPGWRWGAAARERAVQARHPARHLLQPRCITNTSTYVADRHHVHPLTRMLFQVAASAMP